MVHHSNHCFSNQCKIASYVVRTYVRTYVRMLHTYRWLEQWLYVHTKIVAVHSLHIYVTTYVASYTQKIATVISACLFIFKYIRSYVHSSVDTANVQYVCT